MRFNKHFVKFKEEGHQYFNEEGDQYISCTTFIGKYKPPFDSDYWSTYKAVKKVLEDIGAQYWKNYKKSAGGWQGVVSLWSVNPIHTKEVILEKNNYLQEWEDKKNRACVKGTAEHLKRELTVLNNLKMYGRDDANTDTEMYVMPKSNSIMDFSLVPSVIVEAVVWNDEHKIAGQVDYVERNGKYLDIKDYKTNEKIDTKGFMDGRMLHPLGELQDCNFIHYQLQMSLYGWMMEKEGYTVRSLELIHLCDDRPDNYMKMEYRPDWIELLIQHNAKKSR